MLTSEQINTIHRLHFEKWPVRKIARHLHIGRRTIAKYLVRPAQPHPRRQRSSKLDPFKPTITELLQQDPTVTAVVIAQRLRPLGYDGGISILKEYLHSVRANTAPRAYVRMEPGPGERFEIDWGHFGAIAYDATSPNFMPSVSSSATAEKCIWSSRIARPSKLSSAVISTLLKTWAESPANSGMTTWPLWSPNMMAIWYGFIRAFSPLPASTAFSHERVTWRPLGRRIRLHTAPRSIFSAQVADSSADRGIAYPDELEAMVQWRVRIGSGLCHRHVRHEAHLRQQIVSQSRSVRRVAQQFPGR
jgi:hypothetical protein